MVLKDIAEGGEHEVDGIAYIGVLNDYQATGVVNVLTGKVKRPARFRIPMWQTMLPFRRL